MFWNGCGYMGGGWGVGGGGFPVRLGHRQLGRPGALVYRIGSCIYVGVYFGIGLFVARDLPVASGGPSLPSHPRLQSAPSSAPGSGRRDQLSHDQGGGADVGVSPPPPHKGTALSRLSTRVSGRTLPLVFLLDFLKNAMVALCPPSWGSWLGPPRAPRRGGNRRQR